MARAPWSPSDNRRHHNMQLTRRVVGMHVIDTQVRDLGDACDLLIVQQAQARSAETRKNKPRTLRQLFSDANGHARLQKLRGEISLAPVGGVNHNRSRMPERKPARQRAFAEYINTTDREVKRAKIRELYATGYWNYRDLRIFNEPDEVLRDWLVGINVARASGAPSMARVVMHQSEFTPCVQCGGPGRNLHQGEWFCGSCYAEIPLVKASNQRRNRTQEINEMERSADVLRKAIKKLREKMHGDD